VTDVREVKLNLRYPESRQEDITDAFMRGYTNAVEIGNKAIEKLEIENTELRKLAIDLWHLLYDGLFRAKEVPYDELNALSKRMDEMEVWE